MSTSPIALKEAMQKTGAITIFTSAFRHRELLWALAKQDFIGRYKGSFMGIAWSLLHPILLLTIYTLVFSVAFKARWNSGGESKIAFAVVLFSGMIVHSFFAECLNRAPTLITGHPNYVKKIVFPLEIMPWIVACSALMHFFLSLTVLVAFCILTHVPIHSGVLLIPLAMLPLIMLTLGVSWLFASLGVYIRDLAQGLSVLTTILLFLSPVFYPMDALPEQYRMIIAYNPITQPIIHVRDLMLWGSGFHWREWLVSISVNALACYLGYWWFQKTRRGFADVI